MEEDPLIRQLLLQLLLIALNAVFACAEIAIISGSETKRERLAASGDKRAARLLRLTKEPAKFLATIQVGVTLVSFFAGAMVADNLATRMTQWLLDKGVPVSPALLGNVMLFLTILLLSYFTIVLGELVPKRIAMKYAERLSLSLSWVVVVIAKLFAPLVWWLSASTNGLLRLLHIDPNTAGEAITEEEIRMMVDAGSETGAIDASEKDIIHNLFEFDNKTAAEVMTHRTEIVILWSEENDAEWARVIIESRHTYFPICGEDQDDIVGVLSSKDYFRLKAHDRETVMLSAVRPAQFVPESVRTDVLFRNMKKNRNHFAVVLDEYGGMSGVVTMNDLLEELVGDLEDDHTVPPEPPDIEKVDNHTWRVSGTASLDEVAKALSVALPVTEYDSFSSLVFGLLGMVPEDGETPELTEFGMTFRVMEVKEHRLESAEIILPCSEAN